MEEITSTEASQYDEHFPEDSVKVYLNFDIVTATWEVAASSVDGYPLDAANEGGSYCDFGGCRDGEYPGWRAQHEVADQVALPTAEELFVLLGQALGKEGF